MPSVRTEFMVTMANLQPPEPTAVLQADTRPPRGAGRSRHLAVPALLAWLVGGMLSASAQQAPAPAASTGSLPSEPRVMLDSGGVRLGDLGFPYLSPIPTESLDPGRAYRFFGGIGADVVATNNVFQTTNRKSDIFFRIIPSIGVIANTERILANIIYAPSIQLYSTYTSQNYASQNFSGLANLVLVPDSVFLDIQGFGYPQTATGSQGPQGSTLVSRNNWIQNYDARISPYAVLRFGSFATAQVGYAFTYSQQSGNSQTVNGLQLPYFSDQSFIGNRGYALLRSGEDFGRFAFVARIDGTGYSGTGIYDNSHRFITDVELRYAITRNIAISASGGYENQVWNTIPRTDINDAVWSVGVRYNTAGGSNLLFRYGHRDGFNSPFLNANLVLTERMTLQATYFERLSTAGLFTQDLLTATSTDEIGNSIDSQSRLLVPVSPLVAFSSLLTAQTGLTRSKLGSAFLTQSWPRDSVSVGIVYREQTPVAFSPGNTTFQQSGVSGVVNWTHEISLRTSTFAYAQYGRTTSRVYGDGDFGTLSAGIIHRLTPNLRASLQAIGQQNWGSTRSSDWSSAALVAGIRQSF